MMVVALIAGGALGLAAAVTIVAANQKAVQTESLRTALWRYGLMFAALIGVLLAFKFQVWLGLTLMVMIMVVYWTARVSAVRRSASGGTLSARQAPADTRHLPP